MSWIIAIIVGGVVGWLASVIMKTDEQQGVLINIVVGIVGALLARWIFGSLLGIGSAASAGTLSLWGVLWGIIGAAVLIWILRLMNIFR